MTYIETIQAADAAAIAALIAQEGCAVKSRLHDDMVTRLAGHQHFQQKAVRIRYEAEIENILGQLRPVWQMARDGSPQWRDALAAWIEAHEARVFRHLNNETHSRAIRLRLIVEHAK